MKVLLGNQINCVIEYVESLEVNVLQLVLSSE